jgi:serine/threonine protein kinase
VAIKHIPRRFCVIDSIGNSLESKALQLLQGYDNIPQHIDTFYEQDDVFIITEWIKGTNAKEYIERRRRPLSEHDVKNIVYQVANVLNICNQKFLIYGDTKAENVMIEPTGKVKMIDFGCTRTINSVKNCYMGTPIYFSPEMFDKIFIPEYDVWGLGILSYYLATGSHPFLDTFYYSKEEFPIIKDTILKKEITFLHPIWKEWSQDGIHLIRDMLEKDPFKRPSISHIYKHSWFDNNTVNIYNID